jgi:peptidase E
MDLKNKSIFLTSSPNGPRRRSSKGLDPSNGFVRKLQKRWKKDSRVLIISSDPSNHAQSRGMAIHYSTSLRLGGMSLSCLDIWDYHTPQRDPLDYDCIFLSGGPTFIQGMYFEEIQLKEKLERYEGMIIGVSAGSMNSAAEVYAQPEFPGNTSDPEYKRFYPGLGMTDVSIIPHYQEIKNDRLDGMRLFEDITYPDSYGHRFYCFNDGTYLLIEDGNETICGEAYMIEDGKISRICSDNETLTP